MIKPFTLFVSMIPRIVRRRISIHVFKQSRLISFGDSVMPNTDAQASTTPNPDRMNNQLYEMG